MVNKTITQVPVEAKDIQRVIVTAKEQLLTGDLDITCEVIYKVRDATGAMIGGFKVLAMTLTPAQQTTLKDFVKKDAVPACNTAEGT